MFRTIKIIVILSLVLSSYFVSNAAGLDLNAYCQSEGYSYATLTSNNAYGWTCVDYNGSHVSMNLNDACHQQYGGDWWARYTDFNNPYSWECKHWCSVQPNASTFGSQGPLNPNFALRINGPSSLDWNPASGEEYYIYYNGSSVGSGTVDPHGYSSGYMEWGISTSWAASHANWLNDSNWRIDYTLSDNTCPYTKH